MSRPPAPDVSARQSLAFVLPEGSERPSGGNVYNRALLDALAEIVPIRRLTLDALWLELEQGTPGLYFLDSLDLREARWLERRAPLQSFGLIVHHLPSLEPDLSLDDAERAGEAEALSRFDLFLCTSSFTADHLQRLGFAAEKLITVPPAPPSVKRAVRQFAPPLRALVVANLIPRKAVLPLLELLAEREDPAEFGLAIVGRSDIDPGYAAACRAVVARSSYLAGRVRFEAEVPHERMADHYRSADLLLSPARMETFGMAIQEARAHGLPVIVRDGGFVREHVADGRSGLLVSCVEALVDAFLELARDAEAMRELATRADGAELGAGYAWADAARALLSELGRR